MSKPNWASVLPLTESAANAELANAERLRVLFEDSARRLTPLEDPLRVDLGLHRWLAGQREEVYSDWLAWIVEHLRTPALVYSLFGLPPPEDTNTWPTPQVTRERTVPQGHEGHSGRLDLVVCWQGRGLLVVEVKIGDADTSDTGKHAGYLSWIEARLEPRQDAILLATSGIEEAYGRFFLRTWTKVCIELRRMLPHVIAGRGVTTAAMMCAFVAAVERNLLRLPAADNVPPHALRNVADHLASVEANQRGGIVDTKLLAAGVGSYMQAVAAMDAFRRDVRTACRAVWSRRRTEFDAMFGLTFREPSDYAWPTTPPLAGNSIWLGVSHRGVPLFGTDSAVFLAFGMHWWCEETEPGRAWLFASAEGMTDADSERLRSFRDSDAARPFRLDPMSTGFALCREFRPADAEFLVPRLDDLVTLWLDLLRIALATSAAS